MRRQKGNQKSKHLELKKSPKNLASGNERNLEWNFSKLDIEGKWKLTAKDLKDNWEKLRRLQEKTWGNIFQDSHNNPHHSVQIEKIIPDARKRLRELGYETEQLQGLLITFRITGKKRIWAIREGNTAYVLWWDPKHEICPTR